MRAKSKERRAQGTSVVDQSLHLHVLAHWSKLLQIISASLELDGRATIIVTQQMIASHADLQNAELDVAANVWRAYFSYLTARRKYDYAEALLSASQSSYDSNLKSYGHGLATIVDLLSAERALAAARYEIIQSKAEVLISAAAISFATGTTPPQAVAAATP